MHPSKIMHPADKSPSTVSTLPLGAIVQSLHIGGLNIVQGFPTQDDYLKTGNEPYFGETIGRCANRIAGAKINKLNGKSYQLVANNGPNSLHGGLVGWGKKIWSGPFSMERNGKHVLRYQYTSVDGEENYPGTVHCTVWYGEETEIGPHGEHIVRLDIEYEAELDPSSEVEETIVNLTNHR
jgi:aldose 1-epimerase